MYIVLKKKTGIQCHVHDIQSLKIPTKIFFKCWWIFSYILQSDFVVDIIFECFIFAVDRGAVSISHDMTVDLDKAKETTNGSERLGLYHNCAGTSSY